jgi:hypothetical protein
MRERERERERAKDVYVISCRVVVVTRRRRIEKKSERTLREKRIIKDIRNKKQKRNKCYGTERETERKKEKNDHPSIHFPLAGTDIIDTN